jgi:hypothetical protein
LAGFVEISGASARGRVNLHRKWQLPRLLPTLQPKPFSNQATRGFLRSPQRGYEWEAVGTATSIAHQCHGAIGFTVEHRLHWFTTALWSWREEFGGQGYWTDLLGEAALAAGGAGYWQFVTEVA